ncbi:hypothetical protein BH11BAC7_BH11BAC7_08550 [soil metagenome]
MALSPNTNYYNASPLLRISGIACIPVFLFVVVHIVMGYFEIYPVAWLRELHFILQNGLPFFLFLTGTFIHNKKLRIPLLIFFPVFIIGYTIKTLDFWGLIDVHGVKWIICPALLGLLITYVIHFFAKKSKRVLDYLKIIWLLCLSYVLFSIYFPIKFHTIYFFEASTWILILLMTLGLVNFFRKPAL